jgi:hypothetical protein
MDVSSQPTGPSYAVEKGGYRRSNCFLLMRFLVLTTALSAGVCNGEEPELKLRVECNADVGTKVWEKTNRTFSHFEVGGVNLALYKQKQEAEQTKVNPKAEPFELYADFDIADQITGDESWDDLTDYRRLLQRPSLSFYVDKVARKRWLPTMGFSQPRLFALKYAHELTESGNLEDERMAIMGLLPTKSDYAAKPTHMSTSNGVWLVKHNTKEGTTHFSDAGREVTGDTTFDSSLIAHGLSEYLHRKANDESHDDPESWALRNVNSGIVVEERFTDVQNENIPPREFNIFTIWGKVWVAQMNIVEENDRFAEGFFLRNGTMLFDPDHTHTIPDWLDFAELVRIAEHLGANKDMFRTDIFVGVPSGRPALREGATSEEIRASVTIAVSESEIYPTTAFWDETISEEGARLWVAGYKMGNYGIVPNTEVPPEYLEIASYHSTEVWEKTNRTFSHFEVGGVNLALYKQKQEAEQPKVNPKAEPFELYADFDIADQIT